MTYPVIKTVWFVEIKKEFHPKQDYPQDKESYAQNLSLFL
jgi:hypothetical protein